MARPTRIEFSGALYHISSKGRSEAAVFEDNADREMFLQILGEASKLFNWVVHSWCLMTSHYQILLETPDANLSNGMRYLSGVYTQRFNRKHASKGPVFQGRFKATLVEKEAYFHQLARDIVLNPVRSGMVETVEQWPWSSYCATVELDAQLPWFDSQNLLEGFGRNRELAIRFYKQFIAEEQTQPSPLQMIKKQIFLGSDEFIEQMQAKFSGRH